ncbi:hypothetical protein R3P38DRAFT_3173223 [Favolaschia claudopus]|uniref:Uncharacterized protein n=1 Tax=Favolaschia claudopus TaxID=2862362 RepID=A0AAW0DE29_9AGAR
MTALPPTNMTAAEMVPDTSNPDHDPNFWCLPPPRDTAVSGRERGFGMYLITHGRSVGVWHNWQVVRSSTLARAMITGFPGAAYRKHANLQACVEEWQQHCLLGVHPHPPCPRAPVSTTSESEMPDLGLLTLETHGTTEATAASAPATTSPSSATSLTVSEWDDVPKVAKYFALWEGHIVFSDRREARAAFFKAIRRGDKPKIWSGSDYDEAQSFAEGVHWIEDL